MYLIVYVYIHFERVTGAESVHSRFLYDPILFRLLVLWARLMINADVKHDIHVHPPFMLFGLSVSVYVNTSLLCYRAGASTSLCNGPLTVRSVNVFRMFDIMLVVIETISLDIAASSAVKNSVY